MGRNLTRPDLAKQFEGIVQQEIKNFRDASLAIHTKINKVVADLAALDSMVARYIPDQDNKFHNIDVAVLAFMGDVNHSMNEQDATIKSCKEALHALKVYIDDELGEKLSLSSFMETVTDLESGQNESGLLLQQRIDAVRSDLSIKMDVIENRLHSELEKHKKEMNSKPDEITPLREYLEDRIKEARVDSDGVLRELQVYKKSMYIVEKKIENLYTLVERLKRASVR